MDSGLGGEDAGGEGGDVGVVVWDGGGGGEGVEEREEEEEEEGLGGEVWHSGGVGVGGWRWRLRMVMGRVKGCEESSLGGWRGSRGFHFLYRRVM